MSPVLRPRCGCLSPPCTCRRESAGAATPNGIGELLNLGRPEEAEREARAALRDDPDHAHLHCWLAFALLDLGRPVEARAAADDALVIDPESAWAYRLRVSARMQTSPRKPALRDAERAIEIDPDEPQGYRVRAAALMAAYRLRWRRKKYSRQALADMRRAVALDPASPNAHAEMGAYLFDIGDDADAKLHALSALRMDPMNLIARDVQQRLAPRPRASFASTLASLREIGALCADVGTSLRVGPLRRLPPR